MEQWEIDLNNQLADKIQPIIIVKQIKKSVSGFLIFIVFYDFETIPTIYFG